MGTALPAGALDCLPEGLPAPVGGKSVRTIFVYLYGTKEVLASRMHARSGHYMKEDVRLLILLILRRVRLGLMLLCFPRC